MLLEVRKHGREKKIWKGVRNPPFVLFTVDKFEASRTWRTIRANACVGVSQRLLAAGVVRDDGLVGVSVPARIRLCHAVASSQSVGSKTFVGERNRVSSGRRLRDIFGAVISRYRRQCYRQIRRSADVEINNVETSARILTNASAVSINFSRNNELNIRWSEQIVLWLEHLIMDGGCLWLPVRKCAPANETRSIFSCDETDVCVLRDVVLARVPNVFFSFF